jgi:hypothetical protein
MNPGFQHLASTLQAREGRESGQRVQRDRESGQVGLFGEVLDSGEAHATPLPNVPDWTDKEKLAGEKELLGFWVTGHPLDRYMDKVAELASHDSSNLDGLARNAEVGVHRRGRCAPPLPPRHGVHHRHAQRAALKREARLAHPLALFHRQLIDAPT